MTPPRYVIMDLVTHPDGSSDVTFSFGVDDRVRVTIPRTDNLARAIFTVGAALTFERM